MVTKKTTTRKKAAPKAKPFLPMPKPPATAKPKTRVQTGWHKGRPVYSDGE